MDTKNIYDDELTNQEAQNIIKEGTEFLEGLKEDTKDFENVVYSNDENPHNLTAKNMNVLIDTESGENKIIGVADNLKDSFEEMVKKINEDDDMCLLDDAPITEKEAIDYLSNNKSDSIFVELSKGTDYSSESIRELLIVVNRKIKGEKFNVYKALPEETKNTIDGYVMQGIGQGKIGVVDRSTINSIKYNIAESLIDEFITDIQIDRSKNDFARDIEQIYQSSSKDITDASLEYIDERNKAYRNAAEEMEDPEKKQRLLSILDQIDEARALTQLKEFAKTCKIKPIELEKPESRVYRSFLQKYANSTNNIYDIKVAFQVLYKYLSKEGYTEKEVTAFFVAFCKQVSNYSSSIPTEHAYMYYVLYYCVLLDGDKSKTYINNVKEVISNLKERNTIINK